MIYKEDQRDLWNHSWEVATTSLLIITIKDVTVESDNRKEPSWNLKKANWELFKQTAEMNTAQLKLSGNMQKDAKAFNQAIIDAAKVSIPRGYRKNYKPYWTPELEKLHKDLGLLKDKLIQEPSDANTIAYNRVQAIFKREKLRQCRENWQKTTDSLNMDKEGKKTLETHTSSQRRQPQERQQYTNHLQWSGKEWK
ncbi:hypothetical protein ElyMa_003126500 [Elysia marginata]|uniref:Uncharacterized protein n=1 Tax=Elysia marginata TaxID=1093978 RepID=A0AAV4IR33_9GAST|nr:hypothetical protein ElyMa_003126500 [Elysia marginata]